MIRQTSKFVKWRYVGTVPPGEPGAVDTPAGAREVAAMPPGSPSERERPAPVRQALPGLLVANVQLNEIVVHIEPC